MCIAEEVLLKEVWQWLEVAQIYVNEMVLNRRSIFNGFKLKRKNREAGW